MVCKTVGVPHIVPLLDSKVSPVGTSGDISHEITVPPLGETVLGVINSSLVRVIFSGEYDFSATVEKGREAHEAIAGSTFTEMHGMGHFPMSENPEEFIKYLEPVLQLIGSKN